MKILTTLFVSLLSNANSDLTKVYNLAEDVRNVVVETKEFEEIRNPDLKISTTAADKIVAISAVDREVETYAKAIDPDCEDKERREKEKLQREIAERNYVIYFSGMYSSIDEDRVLNEFEVDTYRTFINEQYEAGKLPNLNLRNFNTLIRDYASTNPNYENLSLGDKIKALNNYTKEKYSFEIPNDLLIEEALRVELIDKPNNWQESLAQVKDSVDFNQKMRIAARMGSTFLANYNYSRASSNTGTIVTIEELLNAAQTDKEGGICRDIAWAQGQFLKGLGVDPKSIHIIAYNSATGGHAVLAVQDPENKDRIIKLNYGQITQEDKLKGASALKQETSLPDVGMKFRVFDVDAKPVANIPSEIGAILKDVTNAKAPMISANPYSIAKVGAQTPYGNATIFTGLTSSGDKVVGAAIDKKFNQTKYTSMEAGLALAQKDVDSYALEMSQDIVYGRIKAEVYSPEFTIGNVASKIDLGGEVELFSSKHKGAIKTDGGTILFDESAELESNVELSVGLKNEYRYSPQTKVTLENRAFGFVDWTDVRAEDKQGVAFDRLESSVAFEGDYDRVAVMAKAGIVTRNLGKSYFVSSGAKIKDTETTVYASYSSPVGDDVPVFLPEASKRVSVGAQQEYKDFKFILEYKKDLSTDENLIYLNSKYKF